MCFTYKVNLSLAKSQFNSCVKGEPKQLRRKNNLVMLNCYWINRLSAQHLSIGTENSPLLEEILDFENQHSLNEVQCRCRGGACIQNILEKRWVYIRMIMKCKLVYCIYFTKAHTFARIYLCTPAYI